MADKEQIKNHFIEVGEKDKFTKNQKFDSKQRIDFSKDGSWNETLDAYLSYVALDSHDSDAVVLKLNYTVRGDSYELMSGSSGILTNGKIYFLLDDNETITLDNILENTPNDEMIGLISKRYNEQLHLVSDVATLIKLASARKIEYKISANGLGSGGFVGELKDKCLMSFKGFYNGLFDPQFMKDNLLKYVKEAKETEDRYEAQEAERLEAEEKKKQNDIFAERIAKQREEDDEKNKKMIKYVFAIIVVIYFIYQMNS